MVERVQMNNDIGETRMGIYGLFMRVAWLIDNVCKNTDIQCIFSDVPLTCYAKFVNDMFSHAILTHLTSHEIINAVVLVDKFVSRYYKIEGVEILSKNTIYRLFVTAVIITQKFENDSIDIRPTCALLKFPLEDYIECELLFLSTIDFNIIVHNCEHIMYRNMFQSMYFVFGH